MKKHLTKVLLFLTFTSLIVSTSFNVYFASKINNINKVNENSFGTFISKSVEIKVITKDDVETFATGFVVDDKIITNRHVLDNANNEDNYKKIFYRLSSDKDFTETQLIRKSQKSDIASLAFKKNENNFQLSENFDIGDEIYTIGNPYGIGLTLSKGIISGINEIEDYGNKQIFIKSDITINPGNSGGPVINKQGDIIGIMTFRLNKVKEANGISFFISSKKINEFLNNL